MLKFALEAHVRMILESHPISRWTNDDIRCDQCLQDWHTWFDSRMRRSGLAWKQLVAEFGESVYYLPA